MGRGSGGRGQVTIEAALVLPVAVLACLLILQLAELERARLLVEYASFKAVRAGIVWGANGERMRDAALFALLPTVGPSGDGASLERTFRRARRLDSALHELMLPAQDARVPAAFRDAGLLGWIRVDPRSPARFAALATSPRNLEGPGWRELDFDAPATTHGRGRSPAGFSVQDAGLFARATVLEVRVRCWYELRIPIAAALLFQAWVVSAAAHSPSQHRGLPELTSGELEVVRGLAAGTLQLGGGAKGQRRYFVPLSASAAMRMQSNVQARWLMHEEPAWEP